MIDEIDEKILSIIQKDARTPNAEIARQVGMAPSAIFERIRKLEEQAVIHGYETRLNPREFGLGLVAFIFVRADDRVGAGKTGITLAKIPQVQEVHHIAGEDCYLVKVRAKDTEDLWKLIREEFGVITTISSTRTTIVLETLKETAQLPLEAEVHGKAKVKHA
ncbi:Lrp/AsnC family transcriptional regulator [Candidatus Acetothermia bacterium]|nr:Lrp/AsnC family transcriptional regulator [Candidatus Acetothermia bacterium]